MIMSTFNDVYTVLKDLIGAARKAKNQAVVDLAMDLQAKFFELREDNENLQQQIKQLQMQIDDLSKAPEIEEKIQYSPKGFFTLLDESPKIPYCSCCWKIEHKLVPLSQYKNWFQYRCGHCKTDVTVITEDGKELK